MTPIPKKLKEFDKTGAALMAAGAALLMFTILILSLTVWLVAVSVAVVTGLFTYHNI